MNAVVDAIGTEVTMPATAEKVWRALKDKKSTQKKAA
jgi:carbon-monoxide dehydrogenase large subunit